MAQAASPNKNPARRGTVAVLLSMTLAGALWIPLYARVSPRLAGLPFFYWYQVVLVPVVAVVCWICYLLLRTGPTPGGQTGGPIHGRGAGQPPVQAAWQTTRPIHGETTGQAAWQTTGQNGGQSGGEAGNGRRGR